MLSTTLNTNEVKDRAGVEVEFAHKSLIGSVHEYAKVGETPNLKHRLKVSHQEISEGQEARRRSAVIVRREITGKSGKTRVIQFVFSGDIPVGDIEDFNLVKDTAANVLSFCATTGAGTTVLFDGSGTGADAVINGIV